MPFFGSINSLFSDITGVLGTIFDSISSLRNIIASLGGGINVVFQEFTERISTFFFKLRLSAIHIKTLMGRMYAILFSVMYMGMSGITGMTSFTNTFLFSFLDTFCFPGETEIIVKGKGPVSIKHIKIGDILEPTGSRVTGLFRFNSIGQPMVDINSIVVSTNHYVLHNGKAIKAAEHPDAVKIGSWCSNEPLYCLGTSDNKIPVNNLVFLDYDETADGDIDTMRFIQNRVNATDDISLSYNFKEYSPAVGEETIIRTTITNKAAKDIKIGDKMVTGAEVVGIIRKEITEFCVLDNETIVTPSTMYWDQNKWKRFGETYPVIKQRSELISFVVVPNSQIELENNTRIRDYMELCSPDSEIHYSNQLDKCGQN
jgi:hypothetical protein